MNKPANIREVARRAGVSITTVSRALNGYPDVNEETRKRIMAITEEIGYIPNAVAKSLVTQESRSFGFILSGLIRGSKHTIIQECLCGIYAFAREVGYEVTMFPVDSAMQLKKSYMQFSREHNLAGVILQGIRTDDEYSREVFSSDLPCVLIDIPADRNRVGSVSIDNEAASAAMTDYLLSQGHRNIAFVNGKEAAAVSTQRYEGYVSAMRGASAPLRWDYVLNGEFDEEIAYREALRFLPEHPEVTAAYCASDLMAIGVMRAAAELGIAVPEQLSVTGFDDIPIAAYTTPSLTTIQQDFFLNGYEAARMLYDIIQGKDVPHRKKTPHRLLERNSAGSIQGGSPLRT